MSGPLLLLVLLAAAGSCLPQQRQTQACSNVFCGAGRECAVTENGEAFCTCIERCKAHKRPVCGSNGRTYRNHCELHRHACITHTKIHLHRDGHCLEKTDQSAVSPIVCYAADRNELRSRVIGWLQWEVEPDSWLSTGTNFSQILEKYFKEYDGGDSQLDSSEFLSLLQHNETAVNVSAYASKDNNLLLRSLCVDALIELSDENTDWKLSFDEFLNCLKPNYDPPERECALEDETYEDGSETQMDCNHCVCACGNWVCTAVTCHGADRLAQEEEEEAEGAELEMTEEEWTRRVAELNKHQETVEKRRGNSRSTNEI